MARNVTQGSRQGAPNDKSHGRGGPNDLIGAKVHRRAADGVETIAKVLSERALAGLNISGMRVELGKAHIWDVAVEHLAKELGVEL